MFPGIHFKLGNEIYQFESEKDQINLNRFKQVYSQALSIFNDLFSLFWKFSTVRDQSATNTLV